MAQDRSRKSFRPSQIQAVVGHCWEEQQSHTTTSPSTSEKHHHIGVLPAGWCSLRSFSPSGPVHIAARRRYLPDGTNPIPRHITPLLALEDEILQAVSSSGVEVQRFRGLSITVAGTHLLGEGEGAVVLGVHSRSGSTALAEASRRPLERFRRGVDLPMPPFRTPRSPEHRSRCSSRCLGEPGKAPSPSEPRLGRGREGCCHRRISLLQRGQ